MTKLRKSAAMVGGLVLLGTQAFAAAPRQVKDDLFAGTERFAAGAKDSTEVNLDKNMLGLAGGMSGANDDLMQKMDYVIVRSYEYAKPGAYNRADVEAFRKRLEGNGWSHLVKERSDKESTDVCVKTDHEGQMLELVVIDAEPRELNFVHLKGHMSMADMMKVGRQYGAPAPPPPPPAPPTAAAKPADSPQLNHR